MDSAFTKATQATYANALKSFYEFSRIDTRQAGAANASSIRKWIVWMAARGLSVRTIRTYLSGMKAHLASSGEVDCISNDVRIERVLLGVEHVEGIAPKGKARLPFTLALLREVIDKSFQRSGHRSYEEKLMLAAMSTGICGLLRTNEFTQTSKTQRKESLLNVGQLTFLTDYEHKQFAAVQRGNGVGHPSPTAQGYVLSLRCTKNDPLKEGSQARIGHPLAVELMKEYLQVHPDRTNDEAPLFAHRNGSRLTSLELVQFAQERLCRAGVKDHKHYTGHSFRIGGAQSLHDAGVGHEPIRVAGRWKSHESARIYHDNTLMQSLEANRRM